MKNYFLPMLLSLFFLGACDKNDEIIPEDADENFITSVVMTVDGKSYTVITTDVMKFSSASSGIISSFLSHAPKKNKDRSMGRK